jgi:hypothetical protein
VEIDGCLADHVALGLFGPRKFHIDRKEVTMSVVAAQDRLAGAWSFSAVHSPVTFSVVTAELEFIRAA